ncbi:MAG: replicative DNA helicase [Candidatus Latescibacterota bacterium]
MADKGGSLAGANPPQAPEIERAVLGAMLLEKEAIGIAVEVIGKDEDCFYKPAHAAIFRVITDLYDQNFPVDLLTVTERLRQRGVLEQVGGDATLSAIAQETSSAANVRYHCLILRDKAFLRKMISLATSIRGLCYEDTAEPTAILENLESNISDLSNLRLSKGYVSLHDTVFQAYREIGRKLESKDGLTGVDTGYAQLNRITGGWQPSDLIIVAGRPSMGKTAFALDLAKNAAAKGIPTGIFSLEMSSIQLVMRLLFNEGRFDGSSLSVRKQKTEDWTRLTDACARIQSLPIYIDDTPALSSLELAAKAKRLKTERDIQFLIIDYLQLMQGSSRESRQQEISSISRSLKALAKDLDIPIIALSQLSRVVEQRGGDHKPILSDLRESGAIEQDADVVMFMYRASVYNINPEYKIRDQNVNPSDVAEVIIRKQRNGPIGTVLLHWIKEYMKFSEFDYEASEEFF